MLCLRVTDLTMSTLLKYPSFFFLFFFYFCEQSFIKRVVLPEDVESILRNLSRFEFVDNPRLLRICSQALLYIWRAHWRYTFDGTPFLPQQIVLTIFKKLQYYRLH